VAAAALLVHIVDADGIVESEEQTALHALLKERFALSDSDTDKLIEVARSRDEQAIDLYGYTSLLKRALDRDGRLRLVEMMWELVFADGAASELEENVVWRAAELLGIETRDRVTLRHRIAMRTRPHSPGSV